MDYTPESIDPKKLERALVGKRKFGDRRVGTTECGRKNGRGVHGADSVRSYRLISMSVTTHGQRLRVGKIFTPIAQGEIGNIGERGCLF